MDRFEPGDKVWIENIKYAENVDMIRNIQTVEYVQDISCKDEPDAQMIFLVGSEFIYTNKDLRKDK